MLRSLHWWERLQGEYGWIAQVRTDHPNEISQFLASIRDWLGIGVRTARPAGWAAQRRCVYSGDVGTVARRLHDKGFHDKLLPNLRSRRPSSLRPGEADRKSAKHAEEPDAALLHDHDCVQKKGTSFRRVRFLTRRILNELGGGQTPVERVGGYSQKLAGYVTSDLATFWTNGEPERFSSCVVETLRIRKMWGWLPLPLFKGRFSAPGDFRFLGVGSPERRAKADLGRNDNRGRKGDRRESCVVKSGPLLHYLRRRLRNEAPFTPHVIEDL